MRIFYSFLIIVCSVILIILPFTDASYEFKTDLREDSFTVITDVGAENTTVQLFKPIYDDDVSTIEFISDDVDDSPVYYSYNSTTRALVVIGLADNTTRTLDVTYDISAYNSDATDNVIDVFSIAWVILWIAFPMGALAAIWVGRVKELLGRA